MLENVPDQLKKWFWLDIVLVVALCGGLIGIAIAHESLKARVAKLEAAAK